MTDAAQAPEHPTTGLPAMYHHCTQVYQVMEAQSAQSNNYADGTHVWEGHLTKVVAELNLPNPYYSPITDRLRAMRCIEQIKRGGGGGKSQWAIYRPPTPELWRSVEGEIMPSARGRKANQLEALEQQVKDLREMHDRDIVEMQVQFNRLRDEFQTFRMGGL